MKRGLNWLIFIIALVAFSIINLNVVEALGVPPAGYETADFLKDLAGIKPFAVGCFDACAGKYGDASQTGDMSRAECYDHCDWRDANAPKLVYAAACEFLVAEVEKQGEKGLESKAAENLVNIGRGATGLGVPEIANAYKSVPASAYENIASLFPLDPFAEAGVMFKDRSDAKIITKRAEDCGVKRDALIVKIEALKQKSSNQQFPVAAPSVAAYVKEIKGEVWMVSPAGVKEAVNSFTPILPGYKFHTGAGSSLVVLFSDNSAIKMGPNSELVLESQEKGLMELVKGKLRLVYDAYYCQTSGKYCRIRINNIAVVIRGTDLVAEDTGHIYVKEGSAEVSNAENNQVLTTINEGQQAVIDPILGSTSGVQPLKEETWNALTSDDQDLLEAIGKASGSNVLPMAVSLVFFSGIVYLVVRFLRKRKG